MQTGKEQVLDAHLATEEERRKLLEGWHSTLAQVRALARKEWGYLLEEIGDIIRVAQVEVEEKLLPQTTAEALGLDELPSVWQDLLGVRMERELRESVRNYQDALNKSQQLLEQYEIEKS